MMVTMDRAQCRTFLNQPYPFFADPKKWSDLWLKYSDMILHVHVNLRSIFALFLSFNHLYFFSFVSGFIYSYFSVFPVYHTAFQKTFSHCFSFYFSQQFRQLLVSFQNITPFFFFFKVWIAPPCLNMHDK